MNPSTRVVLISPAFKLNTFAHQKNRAMKSKTVQLYLVVTIAFLVLIFNSCASSLPKKLYVTTHGTLDYAHRQADGEKAAKRPGLFSKNVTGQPTRSENGAGENGVATLEESTDKEAAIEESDNPGTPE